MPNAKNKPKSNIALQTQSETYSVSTDGHFVGADGFIVPKNFIEYYDRSYTAPDGKCLPMGVRRFVMKRLHKQQVDDQVFDMEQELLLHLSFLPPTSKHRKVGKTDIIQCFDPAKQHGASAKRFHNFIARCLNNRVNTLFTKSSKNPLSNRNNLSIIEGTQSEVRYYDSGDKEITPERLQHHSSVAAAKADEMHGDTYTQKIFIAQFRSFVEKNAPEMVCMLDAISGTDSFKEAQATLGLAAKPRHFRKQREKLNLLKECFLNGWDYQHKERLLKLRRIKPVLETVKS